jgi:group I intron endonuclease
MARKRLWIMNKISGIYKITNTITGDFYIGSSKNIKNRWFTHRAPSTWSRYSNSRMYQDMAKYGIDNFIIEVIEETNSLHSREQYYIDILKPSYNNYRADGIDIERQKRTAGEVSKKWHRVQNRKLCIYNEEILTFSTLVNRLKKYGISHAALEAKKYLIESN